MRFLTVSVPTFVAALAVSLSVPVFASSCRTQQVVLASGEVLEAELTKVSGGSANLRMKDGSVRHVAVRSIERVRVDGRDRRVAATTIGSPLPPDADAVLARIRKGDEVPLPELVRLTDNTSVALIDELKKLVAVDDREQRRQAAWALTVAGTPEAMRVALDAVAAHDELLVEVAQLATSPSCLAAIEGSKGLESFEKGLDSRDRTTRDACAWIAAKLGSKAALPILRESLRHRDHHVRESAAMCLAECGDAAGAALLIDIVGRSKPKALAANRDADAETRAALLRACRLERLRAIELLGALKETKATNVLRRLSRDKDDGIRAAATAALQQIEAPAGG